jgi:hypothetical protein
MFGALAIGIGGLLLASKKVRKEIKRFGKKVKKTLKKVVKSKAFKIIAAAALIVTGAYFVAGMMGVGGTAAATTAAAGTAGTTAAAGTAGAAAAGTAGATAATAASTSGIIANTAAAIANGARAVAQTAYSAGQSTTAFLNRGFQAAKNVLTGAKQSTGFSPTVGAGEGGTGLTASGVRVPTASVETGKFFGAGEGGTGVSRLGYPAGKASTEILIPKTEILGVGTGTVAERSINVASKTAAPKGSSLLQKAGKVKNAYDKATEQQKQDQMAAGGLSSFDSFDADFIGSEITTPETTRDFSVNFPLLDQNMFKSGYRFDANSFYSHRNIVRQP